MKLQCGEIRAKCSKVDVGDSHSLGAIRGGSSPSIAAKYILI